MKYLWTKFRRDLMHLFPQFIAVFVMAMLSVTIFSGMESVWTGMELQSENFYEDTNLCDAWIYGNNLGYDNLNKVKSLDEISNATSSMSLTCDVVGDNTENHCDVNVTTINDESNQSPVVVEGDDLDTVIAVFVHMTLQNPLSLVKATESFPVRSPSCQTIQYLLSGYCAASKYRFQEPFSYAPL